MADGGRFDLGAPQVVQAIKDLADSDALTLVVGAGASMEAGLPGWTSLLERLLLPLARTQRLSKPHDQSAFIRGLLDREGLVGAAVTAQLGLGEGFLAALRDALYNGLPAPVPGPTARGVARLRLQFMETNTELVTTNYDALLEASLQTTIRQDGLPLRAASLTDPRTPASGFVSVRHLHGLVTTRATAGEVVLSEAHYHRMQDGEHWQEQFMAERLSESSCMFIGTSLNDPNLLRYLYRQNDTRRPHVACFARQQDVDFYDRATRAAAEATERISDLRWAEAGTRAMRMDHYWEIAQFVWEVQLARQKGPAYQPFPERAAEWESSLDKALLTTGRLFGEIQDEMQAVLNDIVEWLRDRLIEDGYPPARGERLGCSLWVYRPSTGSLTNWFSSDRAWRDPRTLAPVKADWRASLTASRAFCEGQIVWDDTTTQMATRWNYVVGVPLYLEDRVTGRLPVGAMTLASTAPRLSGALARGLDNVVRLKVAETLQQRFVHLLATENS